MSTANQRPQVALQLPFGEIISPVFVGSRGQESDRQSLFSPTGLQDLGSRRSAGTPHSAKADLFDEIRNKYTKNIEQLMQKLEKERNGIALLIKNSEESDMEEGKKAQRIEKLRKLEQEITRRVISIDRALTPNNPGHLLTLSDERLSCPAKLTMVQSPSFNGNNRLSNTPAVADFKSNLREKQSEDAAPWAKVQEVLRNYRSCKPEEWLSRDIPKDVLDAVELLLLKEKTVWEAEHRSRIESLEACLEKLTEERNELTAQNQLLMDQKLKIEEIIESQNNRREEINSQLLSQVKEFLLQNYGHFSNEVNFKVQNLEAKLEQCRIKFTLNHQAVKPILNQLKDDNKELKEKLEDYQSAQPFDHRGILNTLSEEARSLREAEMKSRQSLENLVLSQREMMNTLQDRIKVEFERSKNKEIDRIKREVHQNVDQLISKNLDEAVKQFAVARKDYEMQIKVLKAEKMKAN